MAGFRIPILGYHSAHGTGPRYEESDRAAFAADLDLIRRLGFSVLPLPTFFDWFLAGDEQRLSRGKFVVLTMDDGPNGDYLDQGTSLSMNSLLRDFVSRKGLVVGDRPLATSFVIASPEARKQINPQVLDDHWWFQCAQESLLGIEAHSWDHCNPRVHPVAQREQIKMTFQIDDYDNANIQFRKAREYIESVTKRPCRYFAYPFGHYHPYLTDHYLPSFQNEHQFLGCVTVEAAYATSSSSRWKIPRFICRAHWQSTGQLEDILLGSQ